MANPGRVRAFARACGYEAKTDPLDAQVLSRYGPVLPESETPGTGPEREELQDLLRRRRQLGEHRVQEVNRLDKGVSAGVAESTRRHIAWLEAEIAQLEKEYQEALQGSAQLAQRAALYRTAPGVGPLTAATLVAFLPELGQCLGSRAGRFYDLPGAGWVAQLSWSGILFEPRGGCGNPCSLMVLHDLGDVGLAPGSPLDVIVAHQNQDTR